MPERRGLWCSLRPLQAATLLLVTPSIAVAQANAGTRYRIAEADLARELNALGVNVDASQVHIPAYLSSTTEAPKLEIVTAESIGDHRVRLELRCPLTQECLPFYATVDVKESDLFSAAVRLKTHGAIAPNHQPTLRIGAAPVNEARLRVGSHAVLVIRDGHIDIHLQVLAIDSGAIGQEVRVCTLDRKKVFRATVTGESTVAGMME